MDSSAAMQYRKPAYKKIVERMLREYPILKKSIVEYESYHYPSCITVYEERIGRSYNEYLSSTEQYGIRRADKQMKVRSVEQALKVLSIEERKLIEERYFDLNTPSDGMIYERLGWSKRNYYRIKKGALYTLATFLNFI
ncbi:hypothetical protein MK805_15240 [Shimazuella sp. AN120528]|uniref:ArpU family phage packaging/lysis transcriptional regulator n=1 Tax=Shimazuella soli TaxID=1892854 RepID=UPI001F0DA494|nr:ArpU family phage packaging/lysis transcriptional regulator [Shimazuella soli]MCH5586296.1 hypothetical protein [Shimazuella soli]